MSGFTDIHAHFVYGIDDGAQTVQQMEAMLDSAHADGIASLFATPHVTPGVHPFDSELFYRHLDEARQYCRRRGYPLKLYSGAEILYTPVIRRYAIEGRLPTLADSKFILLEFVPDIAFSEVESAADMMDRAGYTTIMAHVERYDCLFQRNNMRKLKEAYDVRCQINCNTLLRGRGFIRDRIIQRWLREGWIDFVATDTHDVQRRPSRMRAAHAVLEERFGKARADQLTGWE